MSAQVSAAMKARCRHPAYFKKIARAEDLIHHFPNNAYVGWSGKDFKLLHVRLNPVQL
jgi:acetyl-CoA hydrolase